MSARNIGIVYRKELTEALRDRRTLITMFIVPLILFPLLSVGFGSMVAALFETSARRPVLAQPGAAAECHQGSLLSDGRTGRRLPG